MQNRDKVSVIMSVYNEEPSVLIESIESILKQSYSFLQFIIVLDNPGSEELKKIIGGYCEKDNRIIFIENEKNIGLVNSLNIALKLADGKYIARMDADDISHKDRIKIQLDAINKYNCDFVTTIANVINEKGEFLYKLNNSCTNYEMSNEILGCKCIHFHPTWFFKSNILEKVEEYHHRQYVEDYDFLCRTALNGFKIITIDDCLLDVRVREEGITKSNIYEQYLMAKLVREAFNKSINTKNVELYQSILNKKIIIDKNEKVKYINQFNTYKEDSTNLKKNKSIKNIYKFISDIILNSYSREEFFINLKVKVRLNWKKCKKEKV